MNKAKRISRILFTLAALTIVFSLSSYTTKAPARNVLASRVIASDCPMAHNNPAEVWAYWTFEDLRALDPWGDSTSDDRDIIALYEKEEADAVSFRLDLLDLRSDVISPIYVALDFADGGNIRIQPGNDVLFFDIEWDLLVSISGSSFTAYDATFAELPGSITYAEIDRQLDFVEFAISRTAFVGWDANAFQIQALVPDTSHSLAIDRSEPISTNSTTGRAKLVLTFMNAFIGYGPHGVSWYDGYALGSQIRPGERRGLRYLLDATENYGLPLTINDLRIEQLPGNEYLGINDRIRSLSESSLIDPLTTLTYGHHMCWQPDDVDAKAISITKALRKNLGLPVSDVFYPYEATITAGDIQVIQDAGFSAIYGHDQYRYWFGWIDDWSDPVVVKNEIESLRKIHVIDGMPFVFHTGIGNYWGFAADERWEDIDWDQVTGYGVSEGTDQGLHLWWRRVLMDMALDSDQEQFFTLGTDLGLTAWMFQDAANWNALWLASHPWIQVTTFSDLLDRGWSVIDHGDLGLAPDELLIRFPLEQDGHYNAYFPQFYYGGMSDGHSPLIPEGEEIEAYYDYVPYFRDGQPVPSGRIMGDDQTRGSIVYETLQNLRSAPDNDLALLAWLSYFVSIGEQTFHAQTLYAGGEPTGGDWGGQYLHPMARVRANNMRQVNKIVAAAHWASQAAMGGLSQATQISGQDLDLDGEQEVVMSNHKVFAIFENDGGRLEFAFAYDPQFGAVQLVAPNYQYLAWNWNYEEGEVAASSSWSGAADAAFIEDHDGDWSLDYLAFDGSWDSSTLTFASQTAGFTKTFALQDDTIYARYTLDGPGTLEPSFGLVANMLNMFEPNWDQGVQRVSLADSVGWQTSAGGLALVNLRDTSLLSDLSFADSPAGDEMREREDTDSYPSGHWLFYPYNSISVYGDGSDGDFGVSLSLDAGVLSRVYLPLVTSQSDP